MTSLEAGVNDRLNRDSQDLRFFGTGVLGTIGQLLSQSIKTYTSPFLPVEMEYEQAEDYRDCCWLEVNAMTKPMKVWEDQLPCGKEKS